MMLFRMIKPESLIVSVVMLEISISKYLFRNINVSKVIKRQIVGNWSIRAGCQMSGSQIFNLQNKDFRHACTPFVTRHLASVGSIYFTLQTSQPITKLQLSWEKNLLYYVTYWAFSILWKNWFVSQLFDLI